jgi:hypothetical protein
LRNSSAISDNAGQEKNTQPSRNVPVRHDISSADKLAPFPSGLFEKRSSSSGISLRMNGETKEYKNLQWWSPYHTAPSSGLCPGISAAYPERNTMRPEIPCLRVKCATSTVKAKRNITMYRTVIFTMQLRAQYVHRNNPTIT